MPRLLLFTGSPAPESLEWGERHLEDRLLPAFREPQDQSTTASATQNPPVWRCLPLKSRHLVTGVTPAKRQEIRFQGPSQQPAEDRIVETTAEASTTINRDMDDSKALDTQSSVPPSQVRTQYYEDSFDAHDDLQSSQIIGPASAEGLSSSTAAETEAFESFESSDLEIHPQKPVVHARLHSGPVADLRDVPDVAYLRSIVPQTMTVNLVVGVISLSQPRRIVPRKGGRPVELVEVLVGDETHAGFNINIWIPPADGQDSEAPRNHENFKLRKEVFQLRPRDIILARRVALNSFRNQVYGQSLRRGLTSLDLLFRKTFDAEDVRGVFNAKDLDENEKESDQVAKVRRVRDWVVQFVSGPVSSKVKNPALHSKKAAFSTLPLDTP